MNFRARLQNAHPIVIFVFLTVLWGLGTWALRFLTGASDFTTRSLISRGIAAVLFGAVMTGFFVWQRRRAGGTQSAAAISQAIKTGNVPHDAVAEDWVRLLRARERSLTLTRWLNPVVFLLFTALGVYLVIAGGRGVILGWICIVLFAGFGVFSIAAANRQLPKIRNLLNQLGTGHPTQGSD